MDKYNINFPKKVRESDKIRLINQLWKLVPMRENNEDWQAHLNIVRQEISGLVKLYKDKTEGLILMSKLEGLDKPECEDFMLYRKTIFRCIDLFSMVIDDE